MLPNCMQTCFTPTPDFIRFSWLTLVCCAQTHSSRLTYIPLSRCPRSTKPRLSNLRSLAAVRNHVFLPVLRLTSFWRPNIPLSASTSGQIRPNPHTPYIAPHPQRGTPYHRYVILLLPQPSALVNLSIPVLLERDRLGFNVRQFMDQHQLDGGLGGGAHVWREVWNDKVSDIYKDILSESSG